jgi:hypothetical protein
MIKRKRIFILYSFVLMGFFSFCSLTAQPQAQTQVTKNSRQSEPSSVISVLRSAFQQRNPKIETVRLLDVQLPYKGASHHVVVAWGIRKDLRFQGQFNDELFGFFLMDETLTKIERTLDIITTQRWHDYQVKIKSSTIDAVTIVGKGTTYGDAQIRRTYKFGLAK